MKRTSVFTASAVATCITLAAVALPVAAQNTVSSSTEQIKSLPGNSVYKISASLTDQSGQSFHFSDKRGKPVLISMFYNSCEFVCPMLIDTMHLIENGLTPQERERLAMMLISFDPARDDVAALQAVAGKHELDAIQWTVARTDPASVRKIAAALGIQYRQLESGEFNHTTVMILLDADGRIVARSKKMGAVDTTFIAQVKKLL